MWISKGREEIAGVGPRDLPCRMQIHTALLRAQPEIQSLALEEAI